MRCGRQDAAWGGLAKVQSGDFRRLRLRPAAPERADILPDLLAGGFSFGRARREEEFCPGAHPGGTVRPSPQFTVFIRLLWSIAGGCLCQLLPKHVCGKGKDHQTQKICCVLMNN